MQARVLVAEDDAALARIVEALLTGAGLTVEVAPDGEAALACYEAALARREPPDVVLSDLAMPRLDGLGLLDRLRALEPDLPVVLITAFASVDSAVAALRKGAFDYVTKPFRNDQLIAVVKNAARQRQLAQENRALRREVDRTLGFEGLVGRSPGMTEVLRRVERAAPTEAAVLIRGETGTGKELVARALHHASRRAAGPFVSLNCAALPEGLLESELFGHVKGAFTGAIAASTGLFRAAHRGTLLLDEVGEMSPALQAKLLRVLETREVRPVGSSEVVAIDVRIVAATHRDLLEAAKRGAFREDLFYRLAVIEVELPPLRARTDDVVLLARHFLRELARARGEPERGLSPAALDVLLRHAWPGNVRELRSALEHAVTMAEGAETLEPVDLPARVLRAVHGEGPPPTAAPPAVAAAPTAVAGPVETLSDLERRHTLGVLARVGGDRRRAADLLGIDLSTLYRKLKRWEDGAAS
jgi:two-component system response regulator HydG